MSLAEAVAFQITVRDNPGALYKVAGSFRRFNLNIESITGSTVGLGKGVITITLRASRREAEMVEHALTKNLDVIEARVVRLSEALKRELLVARLKACPQVCELIEKHGAKVVSNLRDALLVELVGEPQAVNSFIEECSNNLVSFGKGLVVLPLT